jgi:O-acetyl-ADP-ribose deacetylase
VRRADGGHGAIEVLVGDITDQAVDAIVNPSNRGCSARPASTARSTAAAARADRRLPRDRRDRLRPGRGTPGFRLPAGRVIHTTTLPWRDGAFGELETLEAAYAASLDVARRLRLRTLALPAIGTGAYGYPLEAATEVAVATTLQALRQESDLEEVRFVLFEPQLAETYRRVLVRALGTA